MKAILNRVRHRSGARRYLSKGWTVEGFFRELDALAVNYVVLRWYEALPSVEAGEDIDILVDDRDLPKLDPLLDGRRSRHQPFDVYSVSGLPGTSFRGVPYYPPNLAREILEGSVLWNGLYRVPNPRDAFLSMAYHAVYHKGRASNVPSSPGEEIEERDYSDHDYVAVLETKAALAGLELDPKAINLVALDRLLASLDWRPPMDTLLKLASQNPWLRRHLGRLDEAISPEWEGLACFILRERGMALLEEVRRQLTFDGFDILEEGPLKGARAEEVRTNIRGGVWGRGPWPVNGGPPAYFIIGYDPLPVAPSETETGFHPGLNNRRLIDTKNAVRNLNNHGKRHEEQCNILHSSDNGGQALHYLRVIDPGLEPGVVAAAERIHRELQPPFPVIAELAGNSRRARVYLVEYEGGEAICKMFRAGRERFLEREIEARASGAGLPELSEIVESGRNYVILTRYSSSKRLFWFSIPRRFHGYIRPRHLKAIHKVLLHFRRKGYECIDLKPGNFIFDPEAGLRVIDFEFLQKTSDGCDHLEGCLALFPPGDDFQGELPAGADGIDPYAEHWRHKTGVPRAFIVHDAPAWLMAAYQAGSWVVDMFTKTTRYALRRGIAWARQTPIKIFLVRAVRRVID